MIDSSKTIKAIAVKAGMGDSSVRSKAYDLYWWQALAGGCDQTVNAIEIDNSNNIYLTGSFHYAIAADGSHVAGSDYVVKWNKSGSNWEALGTGAAAQGMDLKFDENENLYLAGTFDSVSGVSAYGVAKWNGVTWESLGFDSGMTSASKFPYSLAYDSANKTLFIGGTFTSCGLGTSTDKYLVKYNTATEVRSDFGSNMVNNFITTLFFEPGYDNLYAAGSFTDVGGQAISRVARWTGTTWEALGSGLNTGPKAFDVNGTILYAGGGFTDAGGYPNADLVAAYAGSSWGELSGGVVISKESSSILVNALKFDNNYLLYIGGTFTTAEGMANAVRIVRWDHGAWSAMGTGLNGDVHAINIDSLGNVYVGGEFTDAGGVAAADKIAKWGKKE